MPSSIRTFCIAEEGEGIGDSAQKRDTAVHGGGIMAGKTILLFVMLFGSVLAGDDPFSGTWILNLSKSKMSPPVPKSLIVHLVVDSADLEVTEELVNNSGEKQTIHGKAKFDGKDYPEAGVSYADTFAYQRVDRNTIKSVAKKAGKVVVHETVVVSPDGKSMTATYFSTDATGKQVTTIAVFERK
jgi:hypothetical protein